MHCIQLAFSFDNIKLKKKRIRYKVPTYRKFYSLYQYDREMFKKLNKARLAGENNLNQEQILEQCFVRDENGNKIKDSDEKHIFRIAVLHRIHAELYKYCQYEHGYNVALFHDEEQAEIKNTWHLSIKERLKLHIALLREYKNKKRV